MIRNLKENLSDSAKQRAETIKNTLLPKIRKNMESIEENIYWLEMEIDDILAGEYDDMFTDSYIDDLVDLTTELSTNLAKTNKDVIKRINNLD